MLKKYGLALAEISNHVQGLSKAVDLDEVEGFLLAVLSSKRVFVYGMGRSGYVARAFAQRLMQIGTPAYFVGETSTPSSGKGDLLVVVTGSGETPSVVTMLKEAEGFGVQRAVVTTRASSTAARLSRFVLKVPGKTKMLEKATYAPFTSLFDIAALAVLDGVTAELMDRAGVTDSDIQKSHANLE
jgi:6-phospho-3-hexuloisomerase